MADAHKRRFDVVAVWKFDRFARSVSHLLRALDTFRVLGIEFVSLSESLNTATPAGRMVFTVLGAVAELERSLIAERVRAGLRNARAKGKRLGRPRVIVDAARIGRLRAQGRSLREIAEELGYSRGLVHKTLANETAFRIANAADYRQGLECPQNRLILVLSPKEFSKSRYHHRDRITQQHLSPSRSRFNLSSNKLEVCLTYGPRFPQWRRLKIAFMGYLVSAPNYQR